MERPVSYPKYLLREVKEKFPSDNPPSLTPPVPAKEMRLPVSASWLSGVGSMT